MTHLHQSFEQFFHRNPQPMWVFRLRDLAFLAVNDAAIALYGYSRDEFLRMTLLDVRPDAERARLLANVRAVNPKTFSSAEQFLHQRKDGELLHVRISAHGIDYNGEPARIVSILDLTDEHNAVQAVRQQKAQSEKILENMIDGLAVLDARGSVTYVNNSLRAMLHLPDGDVPDNYLDYYEVYEADGTTELPVQELPLLRALRGEAVSGAEVVIVPVATGQPIHVLANTSPLFDDDGVVAGAVMVLHDLTALLKTQNALKERKRMLATLMENIPGMVYRVGTSPERRLEFVSQGCFDLTGATADELMAEGSEGFLQYVHPDDRDWLMGKWHELNVALQNNERFQLSYRIVTAAGAVKWIWEQGTAIRNESGDRLLAIEGIIMDVTERVAAQDAFVRSDERFRMLFDNIAEGVFRTTVNGEILLANPALAHIFGYASAEELIEQTRGGVVPTYVDGESRAEFLAELERDGFARDKILQLRRPDGVHIWVQENSRAIYGADGALAEIEGTLEDITDRILAEHALRHSEERFARATRGANDGIWDWNLKTNRVHFSDRWHEQLGQEPGDLTASPNEWFDRVHPEDREAVERAVKTHIDGVASHFEIEHRVRHSDGSYRWMLTRGYKSRDSMDGTEYLSGSQTDITARKQAEAQLQHDAFHDALTGLPNRALLLDRLSHAIRIAPRHGDQFALLYLDLDRFKFVNDSLGHAVGDEVLKEVSRRWCRVVRDYDTLARIGGDEFALLLEKVDSISAVLDEARCLIAELEKPIEVGGQEFVLGVSVGVVFPEETYASASDCLRDADSAMYQAKSAGRDQIVVFEPSMRAVVLKSFRIDNELREAIAANQLQLFYQPIVALEDGAICGYEALVRWFHPVRGMIPPMEFIPFAEESGLVVHLDMWVVNAACQQVAEWRRAGVLPDEVTVSVNLSARQMGRPALPDDIAAALRRHDLDGGAIKIELTETALISNIETAKDIMLRLRELGVGVVLDDFGTGYSSLSYLYQFPFDGIKVDQSFVRQLDKTENVGHLMELIQALGERMQVRVVPEGIEYVEELQRLRQMGFKHAQGYYFGKPMPAEQAVQAVALPQLKTRSRA